MAWALRQPDSREGLPGWPWVPPCLWAPVPAGAWPLALQGELGVAIDALWCGDVAWVHWDATGAAYLR